MLDEQACFYRTKNKLEMEQRASVSRAYPRKTDMNRELISSFKAFMPARKKLISVVRNTTDRDSLRYTYDGTRRVRQLALGCESN